jgi:hypothetical protein
MDTKKGGTQAFVARGEPLAEQEKWTADAR